MLTFDQQPPEFLTCAGASYTYSASQGIQYLNYVVQGGANDAGFQGIKGQRDVFAAWSSLHGALNRTIPHKVNRIRAAGRRIRRAER